MRSIREELPSAQACRIEQEFFQEGEAAWRVMRITGELVAGFEKLRTYGLAATFFGSSRCGADEDIYEAARELAGMLAKANFAVITGGGGGVMEAANIGAKEAGGKSLGFNIELPDEQTLNDHTTDSQEFHYFFSRKIMLSYASEAYFYFPGGFGTLDEFFEIITLVQTKKIKPVPIILYDREYWEPLIDWMRTSLIGKYAAISPEDLELFHLVDSVEEAYALARKLLNC